MAGVIGVEPVTDGFEDHCSANWATPLYGGSKRIWTSEPEGTDLQSAAFIQTSLYSHNGGGKKDLNLMNPKALIYDQLRLTRLRYTPIKCVFLFC